jgi:6-phosphogluconolactonase (cycloisomerase 2 family)
MRRFIVLTGSALALAVLAASVTAQVDKAAVYASVGAELTQYDIDVERATLTRGRAVTLPANVQEAAVHPSAPFLYVGWSSMGASYGDQGVVSGSAARHGVTAFRIDGASGALTPHGAVAPLRARPIHLTTDVDGRHLLVAYNLPSGLSVHRLRADGTIGAEVEQPRALDGGIYGHHVRVLPSNRAVVLVTRGNAPAATAPEDPGALKVFAHSNGVLANRASIAPNGGYGFQARHIDFHPSRPWAYLTLERQNQIAMFRIADESLSPAPLFVKTTLAEPGNVRPGQTTSTIRVHPNGRFVYVGNRASATTEFRGARVSAGGENTIAVFAIDQSSGEPTLMQTIDTRGFQPRTFALDAGGRVLVVGNQNPLAVREGNGVRRVPASLATFKVGVAGTLTFIRTYDIDAQPDAGRLLFWMGIASLGR